MSEKPVTITIGKPTLVYTISKKACRDMERIENPQDLEDGLLAVAFDNAFEQMARRVHASADALILRALGIEPPEHIPDSVGMVLPEPLNSRQP